MSKTRFAPPVSIRLDPGVDRPVRELARRTRQPLGRVINNLLEIALRLQRFPGITFIDGPAGRRAHVVGTGLDVWEIVALLRDYGSPEAVIAAFPRLTRSSVEIAQAYASAYPEEIKEYLDWLERSPEQIISEFPHITRARL